MNLSTGWIELNSALKTMHLHWDEAKTDWHDAVCRDFEEHHWTPLESQGGRHVTGHRSSRPHTDKGTARMFLRGNTMDAPILEGTAQESSAPPATVPRPYVNRLSSNASGPSCTIWRGWWRSVLKPSLKSRCSLRPLRRQPKRISRPPSRERSYGLPPRRSRPSANFRRLAGPSPPAAKPRRGGGKRVCHRTSADPGRV